MRRPKNEREVIVQGTIDQFVKLAGEMYQNDLQVGLETFKRPKGRAIASSQVFLRNGGDRAPLRGHIDVMELPDNRIRVIFALRDNSPDPALFWRVVDALTEGIEGLERNVW